MKKPFLLFVMMCACIFASAQIPNASFEDWQNYSLGEVPTGWNTSDSILAANSLGHSAVKEGTEHCHLSYALKLVSCGIFPVTAPGIATNGIISGSISNYTISGGSADTARSKYLTGCVKYEATSTTDRGVIAAFLFRWNSVSGMRDTIAYTIDSIASEPVLTTFTNEFQYLDFVNQPDTILILFHSSRAIFDASIGSTMIIDNLALSGWVGIQETNSPVTSLRLFPTPADQELTVEMKLSREVNVRYEILNATGEVVAGDHLSGERNKIDVGDLPAGNYFLVLRDENGNSLRSQQFNIAR